MWITVHEVTSEVVSWYLVDHGKTSLLHYCCECENRLKCVEHLVQISQQLLLILSECPISRMYLMHIDCMINESINVHLLNKCCLKE